MKVILIIFIIFVSLVLLWYFDCALYLKKARFTGSEMAKHVIVISLDGIFEQDFEKLCNMSAFKELHKNGSYSKAVNTIYPTLTYPVHTSIITGVYPNKHGVIHNNQFQPGVLEKDQSWFWYTNQVKVRSLFDRAKIKKLKTCSLFWPVTGGGDIDYNIPEILALEGENQSLKILKAGTPNYLLSQEVKYKSLRDGITQPALDKFTTKVAVDTIINKKPNLLAMHLVAVDYLRHGYGVWSKEASVGADVYNNSILEIVEASKKAGTYDDSIFIITTDHGLIDINTNIYINSILRNNGFIKECNGNIEYTAYAQSLGLGAYIYVKDNDEEVECKVKELFRKFINEKKYGIEKIYSKYELEELNGDTSFSFAIEAKNSYAFKEEITNYEIKNQDESGEKYATHGYSPLKDGFKNVFMIAGKGIKKNNNIGEMNIVDIAPTIATILDLECDEFDGRSLDDIFMK